MEEKKEARQKRNRIIIDMLMIRDKDIKKISGLQEKS